MSDSRTKAQTEAEKAEFIAGFQRRFRTWKGVVSRPEVAKAVDMSESRVSEYSSEKPLRNSERTPGAYEIQRLARLLKVSECWLAFESGPRDPIAAQLGQNIGSKFQDDPDLAHICSAWMQASPEDRAILKVWASKYPKPKINPLLKPPPAQPASTLSAGQPKSWKPPLSREELVLILGYLSDVTEFSLAEKPLLVAFERLATALAPLTALQKSSERVDESASEGDNSDTGEPSDEAGEPPA